MRGLVLGVAASLAAALAACGAGKSGDNNDSSGKPITIGTTDVVIALDPAGSYDNGSLLVEDNIYQFLMSVPAGSKQPRSPTRRRAARSRSRPSTPASSRTIRSSPTATR